MQAKIGFIGMGNMGSAIMHGLLNTKLVQASQIMVYDTHPQRAQNNQQQLGINLAQSEAALVQQSDIVILAVKPQAMSPLLAKIAPAISQQLIVSVAAGITLATLAQQLGQSAKIIRVMPNTPALVGEGMISISANQQVTELELRLIEELFSGLGKVAQVPESLIHAVVGVSGSSPAYVFMLIEAMADAAVQAGMARQQAYQFAAQAVKGAAEMVLQTGQHPAELKDMVCSPGGTTIEAVKTLEEQGMRSAVLQAIERCVAKSKQLSGE